MSDKTRIISVRITPEDETALTAKAERAGKPLSVYLRDAGLADSCSRCGGTGVEPVRRKSLGRRIR